MAMRKLLIVAIICVITSAARPDTTGNDLKEYSQFYRRHTESTTLCMGYIAGRLDITRGLNKMFNGALLCEPPGVTGDELLAIAIKYLSDHPEQLHFSAASLILNMYTAAFPCPQMNSTFLSASAWDAFGVNPAEVNYYRQLK
jgi:Ssp1 endopeptidase immunity protein Rap1a